MTNDGLSSGRRRLGPLVLVLAVLLAFANSLRTPFLFDDTAAVERNPTIHRLWSLDVLRPPADGGTTTGRPVVNITYALNYAVSGERVWSYHLLNIALHAGAALLLWGVLRRTLSRAPEGTAFCIALLWALHPLQTETVVSAAQRTELLCAFFQLLTLYAFIRSGARCSRRAWLVVSVVACVLGMGTKEAMAAAPLLVLLYDRTFVAGTFAAAWRARWRYYLALAATWLMVSTHARGSSAGFGLGMSPWHYLLQQCEALVLYLKLALWPHPLVLDYGSPVATSIAEVWWQGLIVVTLLGATLWALLRRPAAGFAGATFFLLLAPSSSFVPLVTQTMAEHRMYLPLAVVLALLVLGVMSRVGRRAMPLFTVSAAGLMFVTVTRNQDYRDAITIWTDNITKRPEVARGHMNLAWALQRQGRSAEANVHFARAVALKPDYVSAWYNWGAALLDQGKVAESIPRLETAVHLAPDHAAAQLNLGTALVRVRRAREAIPHFEAALRLHADADAHYNLGVAQLTLENEAAAAEQFRSALPLPDAAYQLGRMAERTGDSAAAEKYYLAVLERAPDHAATHARLGLLLARAERLPGAAEHLQAAVRLRPNDADLRGNLGNVLLLQGKTAEAATEYEAALRLRPDDARLREALAAARGAPR